MSFKQGLQLVWKEASVLSIIFLVIAIILPLWLLAIPILTSFVIGAAAYYIGQNNADGDEA